MNGRTLRTALLVVAGVALLAGAAAWAAGHREGAPLACWAAVVVVALLIERWRYAAGTGPIEGDGWQLTDERFVDPGSGAPMEVLYNARTGERRYRPLRPPR